jgi:signal transduction histidine kinase
MMATTWRPEATATRRGHLRLVRDDVSGLLAHDLKTPLAAIAMNIDFALGELGPGAPASVRGALEDCRESNHQAVEIVSDMVDAIQLVTGRRRVRLAPVDVQGRLGGSVQRVAADAAARGIAFSWSSEPTSMPGDADLFDRAVARLLDRALRYARAGGSIDVTLSHRRIVICVASPDGAAAVPEAEATAQSLATHFADAVMGAHGGAAWSEAGADGALLLVLQLPGE